MEPPKHFNTSLCLKSNTQCTQQKLAPPNLLDQTTKVCSCQQLLHYIAKFLHIIRTRISSIPFSFALLPLLYKRFMILLLHLDSFKNWIRYISFDCWICAKEKSNLERTFDQFKWRDFQTLQFPKSRLNLIKRVSIVTKNTCSFK